MVVVEGGVGRGGVNGLAWPAGRPWRVPVLTWFSVHGEAVTGVEELVSEMGSSSVTEKKKRDGFFFFTARECVWSLVGVISG